MITMRAEKNIVLGITGGISVYKMCTVVRLLKRSGARVRVLMTPSATEFVTPLTFSTLSQEEVIVSLWPEDKKRSTAKGVQHIDLGLWADLMLIAPATANTIAKLTYGLAGDIIGSTVLAMRAPIAIAPAMDLDMWHNEATQRNIAALKGRGWFVIPPEKGALASGLVGDGRLPEPETLVSEVDNILKRTPRDLAGKKILVTAGPTYEPIDPVRFIGNRSSGKMGFAIANAAALRGANVTLISGPVALETPRNVNRINVETAKEMYAAVIAQARKNDTVIMSAAVADYTPRRTASQKIKKSDAALSLELDSTHDILRTLGEKKGKGQVLIGFALETENELANARKKLSSKNLDFIVLNSTRQKGSAFGSDTNIVTILSRSGNDVKLPKMQKFDVALEILNHTCLKRS